MPQVSLDIVNGQLVLGGDMNGLRANRFAFGFLVNEYKASVLGDKLIIELGGRDATETIRVIAETLKKRGFNLEHGASSNKLIQDFNGEERDFEEFSKSALVVRNFDGKAKDPDVVARFADFQNVVANCLKRRSLYDLQLLAAFHMAFANNSCNFSVPGAGKTSIVYAAYAYLRSTQKVKRLLVVGPLSSFGPWEMEYTKCFGVAPTVTRITGSIPKTDRENHLYSKHPSELTLISYQSVPTLFEALKHFVNDGVMVVLDEAHKAKNTNNGVIAQAVLELAKYCAARVVLTGTPAPNGYQDLYNMFKFIWPNKNVIGFPLYRLRGLTDNPNPALVKKLIDNISPFFIRIRKKDLGLPMPKFHPPIVVQMGPLQRQIYDFIAKRYIGAMVNEGYDDKISKFKAQLAKARIIRLMQAASNPIMLKAPLESFSDEDDGDFDLAVDDTSVLDKIVNYEHMEIPPKFEAALPLIQEILFREEKVVVWAIFIDTVHRFHDFLKKHGIRSKELYGAIPVESNSTYEEDEAEIETREKIIREFHEPNSNFKVIIANPFAVAESISLHEVCHNAIYLEKSFDAARYIQSKDRIHRVGLPPNTITNYYDIMTENSIEEVIEERLELKEARMNQIMESEEIPLFDNACSGLGSDDIKALIRDYVRRTQK